MHITNVDFSEYPYEVWDCTCMNKKGEHRLIEIKNRDCSSISKFGLSEGFVIEKAKYDALIDLCNNSEEKIRAIYVNHFTDGITAWWFLDEEQIHWGYKQYNRTNCGDTTVIPKYVGNLKIRDRQSIYIAEYDEIERIKKLF